MIKKCMKMCVNMIENMIAGGEYNGKKNVA